MPTYEYECDAPQHHRFERFQRFSEPPVEECPECGSTVHRVIFPVGIVFKGPGFFRTDNKSRSSASSEDATGDGAAEKPEGDGKPAEAKSDAGAPAATASDT